MIEDRYREIGALVRDARRGLGLGQEDLAHAAGLSVKTASRVENGKHELRGSTARKLAEALQLDVRTLLAPLTRGEVLLVEGPTPTADAEPPAPEKAAGRRVPRPRRADQRRSA